MSLWETKLAGLGTLLRDEPMGRHTTLGVGGAAHWFFRPAGLEALIRAVRLIPTDLPLLPLGRGSNILVPDAGVDGMVVDLNRLDGIEVENSRVRAEAGARMGRVARRCADRQLTGAEFMATVPGDVGGGVVMNAGAFGQQVADILAYVELLHRDGTTGRMEASRLEMSYRRTELPPGAIVLAAGFELDPGDGEAIRARMRDMRDRRGDTQPLDRPNCGSVFRNPPGDHAGRLIEAAGLKGRRIGGARISERHANFIVNEGTATSADVLALIRAAQEAVRTRFGVELEPEVRILEGRP